MKIQSRRGFTQMGISGVVAATSSQQHTWMSSVMWLSLELSMASSLSMYSFASSMWLSSCSMSFSSRFLPSSPIWRLPNQQSSLRTPSCLHLLLRGASLRESILLADMSSTSRPSQSSCWPCWPSCSSSSSASFMWFLIFLESQTLQIGQWWGISFSSFFMDFFSFTSYTSRTAFTTGEQYWIR